MRKAQGKGGFFALAAVACVGILALVSVKPAQAQQQQTAGTYFKNVTSSTLKGLSPSDFFGAMGVMTAAMGYDCSNCHPGAGTDGADWVTDSNPKKKAARRMVEMVAVINKQQFGGGQLVTCWTCHRGQDEPTTTIALDKLYGAPNEERRDIVATGEGEPPASEILDKYLQAVGGAQKWSGISSYSVTGTSLGYASVGGRGTAEILAKAPDHRAIAIRFMETKRPPNVRTFNGKTGWIDAPRNLLGKIELTGSDLEGARLDALVSFPQQIKGALRNWRVGLTDTVGDHETFVVQGNGPNGLLATFYFDKQSYLLLRVVRYTPSPIGRISVQSDFDDYRDVNGVKIPYKYTYSWLDGRDTFQMNNVTLNMAIDEAKFGKP